MKPLSILIITYNRPEETLALLQSLAEQDKITEYVEEILILNNASSQPYKEVENYINLNHQLAVQYIYSQTNLGVARGRNFLIKKAKAPTLFILDDDVVFASQNAISVAVDIMEKAVYRQQNVGIITVDIFYYHTGQRQYNAFPHKNSKKYVQLPWFFTYYFIGAAHLMQKEMFEKTGYYPEDFFYGMEEYDLSYRALNAGYRIAFDNSIKVLHKESPLGRVSSNEKSASMWVNKAKVSYRYLPIQYFISTSLFWSVEYLRRSKFNFKGFFKCWKAIFKIPGQCQRAPLSKNVLQYLKEVEARLWY